MKQRILFILLTCMLQTLHAQEDIVIDLDSIKNIKTTRYSSINEVSANIHVAGKLIQKFPNNTIKKNVGIDRFLSVLVLELISDRMAPTDQTIILSHFLFLQNLENIFYPVILIFFFHNALVVLSILNRIFHRQTIRVVHPEHLVNL